MKADKFEPVTAVVVERSEVMLDLTKLQHHYDYDKKELVIFMPMRSIEPFTKEFVDRMVDQLGERRAEMELDDAAHKLFQVQAMNEIGKHIK